MVTLGLGFLKRILQKSTGCLYGNNWCQLCYSVQIRHLFKHTKWAKQVQIVSLADSYGQDANS